jgi:hypothetical protein
MYKIFTFIRLWLAELLAEDAPADPLATMSPRELADLPVHHPNSERCLIN